MGYLPYQLGAGFLPSTVLLLLILMDPCAFTNYRKTHAIHFDYWFCKKSPKTSWPPWFVPLAPQLLVALIGCGSQHAVLVVLVVALALVALVAPVQHLGGAFNIFKSNHLNRGWKGFLTQWCMKFCWHTPPEVAWNKEAEDWPPPSSSPASTSSFPISPLCSNPFCKVVLACGFVGA